MELSGAVVACRMYEMMKEELDIDLESVTFWTDSMIVLGYIRNISRRFKTFVANRLSLIHASTSVDQWRYVDTKYNPADVASRGINVGDRKRITMWLNGPDYLWTEAFKWPNQASIPLLDKQDNETKKEISINSATLDMVSFKNVIYYFSDWYRLKRAVAWLIRFKLYCKHRFLHKEEQIIKGDLTVNELHEAESTILRYTQHEMFSTEFDELSKNKQVKKSSRMADLNPALHDELIRVKGRLDLQIKLCPIILPHSHHVTTLIIRSFHENNGHTGMSQVLASLREKYWILNGPSSVKRVIKQCFRCRRYHAPVCNQKMAPILTDQKTTDRPPFTFVGIDYFGPFNVKIGRSVVKRYECIFTCLTTRAVHLEVAHSMSSNSFIAAFQRFTSRRGLPEKVYSDNGTNFVSGESELNKSIEQWSHANITKYMSHKNIEWTFNPPYASHRGGVWERMIRETRKIMKGLVNEQLLTDEQLVTFMTEADRIINDRPTTPISNDPRDPPALTPNMLLLMKGNSSVPQGVFNDRDVYAKRWWRQVQYLADVFWRRWLKEYLPTLQRRRKWQKEQPDIKVNDVVIISDDSVPRGQWPLGRVIDVVKSRDGLIRSCVVRTQSSEFLRPITKLCLLECAN